MSSKEDFKFFLANQMQSFASILLTILIDSKQANQTNPSKPQISNLCHSKLVSLASEALQNKPWALKVFDSTGRLRSGLASGSLLNSIGNYHECNAQLQAKYCLGQLDLSSEAGQLAEVTGLKASLFSATTGRRAKLGICAPKECSSGELLSLTNHLIEINFPRSRLLAQEMQCDGEVNIFQDETVLSKIGLFLALLLVIFFLSSSISATILDSVKDGGRGRRLAKFESFMETFSLMRNYKRLVAKRKPLPAGKLAKSLNLNPLEGFRVLSVIWIIIIHSYNFAFQWLMFDNVESVENVYKTLGVQWIANGTFSVDNFFLLSGLLTWLKTSKNSSKKVGRLEIKTRLRAADLASSQQVAFNGGARQTVRESLLKIFNRYLRLAPLPMFLILLSVTILPRLANNHQWTNSTQMFDGWCHRTWPWNLLMVQNLINTPTICFGPTWYIATDFQLFILLQVLIALPLSWNLHLLAAFCLLAQLGVAFLTLAYNLPTMPLLPADSPSSILNFYQLVYIKPYYWLTSYSMGVFLGSLMISIDGSGFKLRSRLVFFIQLLCLLLMLCLLASTLPYFRSGLGMSKLESSLYSLLARPLWSASASCLLLFACLSKRFLKKANLLGRLLRSLLEASLWLPLSRLSYSAYLLHPPLMAAFYGSRRETFEFSHSLLLYFTLGNICLTYLAAFAIYLFLERPIEQLLSLASLRVAYPETGSCQRERVPANHLDPALKAEAGQGSWPIDVRKVRGGPIVLSCLGKAESNRSLKQSGGCH